MSEKVTVVNAYVGNQTPWWFARWLKNFGTRVAIVSEAEAVIGELRGHGKVYFNKRDQPTDVAIAVYGWRPPKAVSWTGRRLTPFIKRPGADAARLWRDRWVVRVRIWRRVYYSIHANAAICGPEGHWLGNKGAKAWRHALTETLKPMIERDIKRGLRVRVGGDFNFPKSDAINSPNNFFESLGMSYRSDGAVMWIAWTPKTDKLVRFQNHGKAPGADAHDAISVVLQKRWRRRR